jgi:small subunit ribosomal protein S17e|tara:strand:- start:280 stop:456 length:177 start_codon:yes stop_codon:yes gene_type:complete
LKRVWKISNNLLENNELKFTKDFEENKKILNDNVQVSSKKLRNQIAGYISKTMNNRSE